MCRRVAMNSFNELNDAIDSSDEEGWMEDDVNEDIKCLFCDNAFCTVESALSHCSSGHNLSFPDLTKKFPMDCYSFIKLINYIRKESVTCDSLKKLESCLWDDNKYLAPVEENDPWLMFDYEEHFSSQNTVKCEGNVDNCEPLDSNKQLINQLQTQLEEKNEEIEQLKSKLIQMTNVVHKILQDENVENSSFDNGMSNQKKASNIDNTYFDSYSHHGIHYDMLSDNVRTLSYKNAVLQNKRLFEGKSVLDLGCGTGILSMFAVTAGAEKVYAIDNSDIVCSTIDIVRENNMQNKIDVIKSRIESHQLPIDKVDIIVSEWMGYFLLFEGMLDSLIYSRERYLKPGGIILPDACNLYICGANDSSFYNHVEFWSDVHGYQMSCIQKEVLKEVVVDVMPSEKIITTTFNLFSFNLYECTVEDTNFKSEFELTSKEDTLLTTFVGHFDALFNLEVPITLSCSPFSTPTHWKQTLFYISDPISLKKDEKLKGTLTCQRHKQNSRSLIITIEVNEQQYKYDLQ